MDPVAFPGRRRGVDDLLGVLGLDVLAGDRGDDRGGEPLAQPALGICVPARPPVMDRESVRVEVVGDEGGAGPPHVRRVGLESLGDLLQLGGQLLLGRRLALLPLPVLVPDRTPPAALGPRRVHRDPALQLDHLAAAPGCGASGATREDSGAGRALAFFGRPAARAAPCGTVVGILWGSWPARALACVIGIVSLPAFMQVRGLMAATSWSR